jgi:hypothetical protein
MVFLKRAYSLLSIAYYSYFFIVYAELQQTLHLPSSSSLSVEVKSFKPHSTLKFLLETNFPQTQHQFFTSFYLKAVFEMGH